MGTLTDAKAEVEFTARFGVPEVTRAYNAISAVDPVSESTLGEGMRIDRAITEERLLEVGFGVGAAHGRGPLCPACNGRISTVFETRED